MSAYVTPIRSTMTNPYGQTMSLHLLGLSSALLGAPSALLERGFAFGRRSRTAPPPRPPVSSAAVPDVSVRRDMTLTRTETSAECVLRIGGALDVHSAPEVRAAFDAIVSAERRVVTIDLEELTMLDSSGVGAIVSLFKRLKAAGGCVVVKGVQKQPLAVCKLLKLDRVFGL